MRGENPRFRGEGDATGGSGSEDWGVELQTATAGEESGAGEARGGVGQER